jgi:hypothetical protein
LVAERERPFFRGMEVAIHRIVRKCYRLGVDEERDAVTPPYERPTSP